MGSEVSIRLIFLKYLITRLKHNNYDDKRIISTFD